MCAKVGSSVDSSRERNGISCLTVRPTGRTEAKVGGEPAWPNDLLYFFPVVILGTIACNVGLAVLEPSMIGEPTDPFATPLEILPEWYFFPVFQILRTVPNTSASGSARRSRGCSSCRIFYWYMDNCLD
ncbi:hypothetical protein ZWY2020_058807 [Hordeum vulgare]|nr:hypothetical protein ZWY2020_058807 [Hordeum vulgare]